MKRLISGFVKNQSGTIDFEDGLTVFSLTIGFVAALWLMNGTFVRLYAGIFGLLPGAH
jgi:hypothetical protein